MKQSAFASLFPHLWPDVGPCPFVVDQKRIVLRRYDAGRDATYVTVSQSLDAELPQRKELLSDVTVMIGYASFVQGTTIIYDVTEETLQGKARPFSCNLGQQSLRMYALLPFQIEATALHTKSNGTHRYLNVKFVDARGERMQAALPFELRLIDREENTLAIDCCATARDGRFVCSLPYRAAKVLVRSRLTGREELLTL